MEENIKDSEIEKEIAEDISEIEEKVEDDKITQKEADKEINDEINEIMGGQKIINKEIKNKINYSNTKELIEQRKETFLNFLKKGQMWIIILLIIAVILGVYIRSMPMHDHGGNPGLWDITTNTWTLGPDLDPWLFTRYAKIIAEQDSLPKIDMMRNVPLGFDMSTETMLLPYMIKGVYDFFRLFNKEINVEFAAVIFPVIMFALTIIVFFLFVREIFIRKSKESIFKANIIALISTFLMVVIPVFLSRTIAGIPEKESAAFFFMFFAFYLFLKSWKSENLKNSIILASFAGIITGALGLVWGGVLYVFVPIAFTSIIFFFLNKVKKKEFITYSLWIIFSFILLLIFPSRYSLLGLFNSLTTGLAFFVFFIFLIHFILWNTKLSKNKFINEIKLPKTIISLLFSIILLILIGSILFGPLFIVEKAKAIHQNIFKPITGRWNITVAENRQPYFIEWGHNFGPFIKNIPILFWLFFMGSVIFFKNMLKNINKKSSWILTGLYVFFLLGIIFSRYASHPSILDGEGFISKLFYYSSVFLLICGFIYFSKYKKENFKDISYESLVLLFLFILCLVTARGAIRLIMVLAPVSAIFVGYLIVYSIDKFKKTKDETWKIIIGALVILILLASIFIFWNFYKTSKGQAYSFIPSYYNQQWQKAMQWVRDETPNNAVFGHWWDYGYWVQSIGNRATVLDGGNAIGYWNYLMGRLVLTGDNQEPALEFLYNHNTTHFLIDSTDIGKYTAFSSIGSNEDYDRYSWFGTFLLDDKQTQETKNQTFLLYVGGITLDEDLVINESGKEILLPAQNTGVGGIIISIKNLNEIKEFKQPTVIMIYQGIQHRIKLRYMHINGEFIDFKEGIEAGVYIFPRIGLQGEGIQTNPIGAAMFLSPRLMRGMLTNIYILDDPLNKFSNFELTHTQSNIIIENLNSQGMNLPDFVYYQGIQGPIKIWEIKYTGKEEIKEEYLDVDYTKYINITL